MLRDYMYTLNPLLIVSTFAQFETDEPFEDVSVALVLFRAISPESFIWKFVIDNTVYYLYAQDHVESKAEIRQQILATTIDRPELEFIPVRSPKLFEQTGPFQTGTSPIEPLDVATVMRFALDVEFDFAFLCRSDEDEVTAFGN